jgi:hypothetical protein
MSMLVDYAKLDALEVEGVLRFLQPAPTSESGLQKLLSLFVACLFVREPCLLAVVASHDLVKIKAGLEKIVDIPSMSPLLSDMPSAQERNLSRDSTARGWLGAHAYAYAQSFPEFSSSANFS